MKTTKNKPIVPLLFTDTETFSDVDIKKAGTVKYATNTEMLLAGFKLGKQYDYYDYTHRKQIPSWVLHHIRKGGYVVAHNALFDYLVLKPHIPELEISQMIDSSAVCAAHSLPMSLDKSTTALDLPIKKYGGGSNLIRKFCIPRKPTKFNSKTRLHATDEPEAWIEFRDVYLKADIESMELLIDKLGILSDAEQKVWVETQIINLQGIPIDAEMVDLITLKLDKLIDDESTKFIRMTGLFPTQRDKILGWVRSQGCKILDLQADTVRSLISNPKTPENVKEALTVRADTSHMSFKKYPVMKTALMPDQTIKGTLMYHAATTGRFGGRLLQPQNLTKGNIDGNDAVQRIKDGEFSVDLVKSAVRPMIYHPDGFTVVDYSSIEARVVQWLAKDEVALQVFRDKLDPYKWMAQKIYSVEYDEVTSKQRFTGKQAILGLGYSMSAKKFISMVESYGESISKEEATFTVNTYRKVHKKAVNLWKAMNDASAVALQHPKHEVNVNGLITFYFEDDFLYMFLPSGRRLAYYQPNISFDNWGTSISYMSMNEKNQFVRTKTYGGKLVENAVQAMSRDILVDAVSKCIKEGYYVATHIHDEIVIRGTYDVEVISKLMCELPEWATGLPLDAEGFNSPRFIKG